MVIWALFRGFGPVLFCILWGQGKERSLIQGLSVAALGVVPLVLLIRPLGDIGPLGSMLGLCWGTLLRGATLRIKTEGQAIERGGCQRFPGGVASAFVILDPRGLNSRARKSSNWLAFPLLRALPVKDSPPILNPRIDGQPANFHL